MAGFERDSKSLIPPLHRARPPQLLGRTDARYATGDNVRFCSQSDLIIAHMRNDAMGQQATWIAIRSLRRRGRAPARPPSSAEGIRVERRVYFD